MRPLFGKSKNWCVFSVYTTNKKLGEIDEFRSTGVRLEFRLSQIFSL